MKKYLFLGVFGLISLSLLTVSACKKKVDDKKSNGPEFNLDKFDTELKASMSPAGSIGWGYVIVKDGLFAKGAAFGKARNNADGNLKFTLNKKINIASVSKWLTAIAAMQLLERRGLTINDKIITWLPPAWTTGPGVNNLTFGQLLGHTSGLSSANTQFATTLGWAGLRRMIDTGVTQPTTYNYLNANFALFRILIPSLWKGLDDAPAISGVLDSATTENVYIQYMQEHVFEPIGLTGIDCEPEARGVETLYYRTSDLEIGNGVFYNSWKSICGGGGYFITTMELARVLAYYRHTETIISKESRKVMEDNRFGYNRADGTRQIHGSYFAKNGSISTASVNGQGVLAEIACLPNGIEVVVVFNTQGMIFAGAQTSSENAIFDAYNKAWE